MMRLQPRQRIKRLYWSLWSLPADAKALYVLAADPVYSASYYPAQKRKSKLAIAVELLWWWIRFREVNRYYYLYGLDRAGTTTRRILPYRYFRAMRDSANLYPPTLAPYYRNSYNFVCIMRDKMLFSQVAASLDIPTPKSLAVCSSTGMSWIDSGRRVPLEALVSDATLRIDCVCKPVDGIMGASVFLLQVERGRLYINRAEATLASLKSRLPARHLLQTRVSQHPQLARLHPGSVNTLRLLTFNTNGVVILLSAALRIGTNGCSTDNWSAGGILVAIDCETGVLCADGYLKPGFGQRVQRHPDTGITFAGVAVPCFEQAVSLVRKFHDHLPGLHSVGWDVAITPNGPVVVEGNDDWDGAVPMVLDPDFRKKFMSMF